MTISSTRVQRSSFSRMAGLSGDGVGDGYPDENGARYGGGDVSESAQNLE